MTVFPRTWRGTSRVARLGRALPVLLAAAGLIVPASPAWAADAQQVTVTNGLAVPAAGVTLTFSGSGGDLDASDVTVHPDGGTLCGPAVVRDSASPANPPPPGTVAFVWGARCVDPGEKVTFQLRTANGPLGFSSGFWTDSLNQFLGTVAAGHVTFAPAPPAAEPDPDSPVDWGCAFAAVRDVTDQGDPRAWIEVTSSYFVGTPDTSEFEVSCWLQTSATFGEDQIPNTDHSCSGEAPQTAGACNTPVIYEIDATDTVYLCAHAEWTGSAVRRPPADSLVEHVLGDTFATGGMTTLGDVAAIVGAAVRGVNAILDTLPGDDLGSVEPSASYAVTLDYHEDVPGVQCRFADHSQGLVVWGSSQP